MNADPTIALEGLVHRETQVHGGAVDLTVSRIFAIDEPAHLDFGGSELQLPATSPLPPEKRHPDDSFGWWSLEAGTYLVEYNERLIDPPAFIQPRDVLIAGGGIHASGWVESLDRIGLVVEAGLEVKENARISTLFLEAPR